MGISDLLKKNITKSARFKEVQEERKIQRVIEEREKSSNERELERFHEEEREKAIAKNLEEFRKHRQKESMETTVLSGPNMFKGKGNIMTGRATVLQNSDTLFSTKKKKKKGLFFS